MFPILLWLMARLLWNNETLGFASASFCWIAAALLCDSSDATVFPVFRIRWPVLVWFRQVILEPRDPRVGVSQPLLDSHCLAVRLHAAAGLPVCTSTKPMLL